MTLNAQQVDRDLHLTVDGADTFVVRPLPGRIGKQITDTYLDGAAGNGDPVAVEAALMIAVDGGVWDDETARYVPRPDGDRPIYDRISDELRLGEAESILLPAFFWQTVLGIAGVNAYIEGGEGIAGGVKALWALVARLGLSPLRTSPSSALENLIRLASTPTTTSPTGGAKSDA